MGQVVLVSWYLVTEPFHLQFYPENLRHCLFTVTPSSSLTFPSIVPCALETHGLVTICCLWFPWALTSECCAPTLLVVLSTAPQGTRARSQGCH